MFREVIQSFDVLYPFVDSSFIAAFSNHLAEFSYEWDRVASDSSALSDVGWRYGVAEEYAAVKIKEKCPMISSEVCWDAKWENCSHR